MEAQASTAQRAQQAPTVELPKRLPLITQPSNRSADFTKDSRLVNCYAEKSAADGQYVIEKRYGLSPQPEYVLNGVGKGIYNWIAAVGLGAQENLIQIAGTTVYSNLGLVDTATPIGSTVFGGGIAGIARFQPIANNTKPLLVFGDGSTNPYYTDGSSGIQQVTNANFPGICVPGFAYLDGTLYVMTTSGAIYGSANLNDPTVWSPLNVIQANAYPDIAVALTKQLTYVIALKAETTQFFYDAGNATGSPLQTVPGALLNYGCISADTLQEIDGLLFWATSNATNSAQILMLRELQPSIVSTPAIDRQLDLASPTAIFRSFTIKHGGHRLYVLSNVTVGVTLVYDIDQRLWYQWTDYLGGYYPIVSQTIDNDGSHLFQHISNGNVYEMDTDNVYSSDYGNVFPVDIYTPNFDAGVNRDKYLAQMWINADQQLGSLLDVRRSVDDYQTWTNFRRFDLSKKRPSICDCGSFRRAAWHFRQPANTPFRIESVDLNMDLCTL